MKEEYIRDYSTQKILGILRTDDTGDQIAYDFPSRKILGYYRSKRDQTTDFLGTILTPGNTVISLIFNNKK